MTEELRIFAIIILSLAIVGAIAWGGYVAYRLTTMTSRLKELAGEMEKAVSKLEEATEEENRS